MLEFTTTKISEEAIGVLRSITVGEDNIAKLNAPQLDKKLYAEIKKVLTHLRGTWIGGKTQGFSFKFNPTETINKTVESGFMPMDNATAYFPTKQELVDDLLRVVDLDIDMGYPFDILEPSAGGGAIASRAREKQPKASIDTVEFLDINQAILEEQGFAPFKGDFMHFNADYEKNYDYVLMNPPFSLKGDNLAYITHFNHAQKMLKPHGVISAIVPTGFITNKTKKNQAFYNLIANNGDFYPLPKGSFKETGTMVDTVIVTFYNAHNRDMPHQGYKNMHSWQFMLYLNNDSKHEESLTKLYEKGEKDKTFKKEEIKSLFEKVLEKAKSEKVFMPTDRMEDYLHEAERHFEMDYMTVYSEIEALPEKEVERNKYKTKTNNKGSDKMGAYLYFKLEDREQAKEAMDFLCEEHEGGMQLNKLGEGIHLVEPEDIEYARKENPHMVESYVTRLGTGDIKTSGGVSREADEAGYNEEDILEMQTKVFEALNEKFKMKYYARSCAFDVDGNYFSIEQMKKITQDGKLLSGKDTEQYLELIKVLENNEGEKMESVFKYELNEKENAVYVTNLADHYTTEEISQKFINKSVLWEIFASKYIFDLGNEEHVKLLQEELSLPFGDKNDNAEKINEVESVANSLAERISRADRLDLVSNMYEDKDSVEQAYSLMKFEAEKLARYQFHNEGQEYLVSIQNGLESRAEDTSWIAIKFLNEDNSWTDMRWVDVSELSYASVDFREACFDKGVANTESILEKTQEKIDYDSSLQERKAKLAFLNDCEVIESYIDSLPEKAQQGAIKFLSKNNRAETVYEKAVDKSSYPEANIVDGKNQYQLHYEGDNGEDWHIVVTKAEYKFFNYLIADDEAVMKIREGAVMEVETQAITGEAVDDMYENNDKTEQSSDLMEHQEGKILTHTSEEGIESLVEIQNKEKIEEDSTSLAVKFEDGSEKFVEVDTVSVPSESVKKELSENVKKDNQAEIENSDDNDPQIKAIKNQVLVDSEVERVEEGEYNLVKAEKVIGELVKEDMKKEEKKINKKKKFGAIKFRF